LQLKQAIKLKEHTPFVVNLRDTIRGQFFQTIADFNQTYDSLDIKVLAKLGQVQGDQFYEECLEAFMLATLMRIKP